MMQISRVSTVTVYALPRALLLQGLFLRSLKPIMVLT